MNEPSFEESLAELDGILRDLENEATSLDDALQRYERGIVLLRCCYDKLKNAEQKIVKLTGFNPDGTAATEPFEHTAAISKAR